MIAVTFALPAESSEFIRLLADRNRRRDRDLPEVAGTLCGNAVRVLHTGVGERAARARIESFLVREKPNYLISSGFAGALTETLRLGDLLLADNFSDPALLTAACSAIGPKTRTGKLTTAALIADSATERADLARIHGAIAVDMETACLAQACAVRGIPMLSLRAITDTPAAPLTIPPHVLFNLERQRTDLWRLIVHLLRHPGAIGGLISLAQRVKLARRSLAEALQRLIASETFSDR